MKIIEFYNDSCGACKLLKPILQSISNDLNAELTFVNVDTHPEEIVKHNITSLPYTIIEDEGRLIEFVGFRPYKTLHQMINKK